MTVEQLIKGLKNYKSDLKIYFAVPGEQGRSEQHYEIENFDAHFPPMQIKKKMGNWQPDYIILRPSL